MAHKYLQYWKNYLSFEDGKIFAGVAQRQNRTITNRKILFCHGIKSQNASSPLQLNEME